jgi:hypothetical protein
MCCGTGAVNGMIHPYPNKFFLPETWDIFPIGLATVDINQFLPKNVHFP